MKKVAEFQGKEVIEYTVKNTQGMTLTALNYGAVITGLHVPYGEGQLHNTVLAHDDINEYEKNDVYFGALVGRTSGRTENAELNIEGKNYRLEKNDGENHLHGGNLGLTHRFFQVEPTENGLIFRYQSPHGEEGYPGNLSITVTYSLTEKNELHIDYNAETDAATPVNLTNHSYFNLGGNTVHDHQLKISSDYFYELRSDSIPLKKQKLDMFPIFDFREPKTLRTALNSEESQISIVGGGIDHPYELSSGLPAAVLSSEKTGLILTVETDDSALVVFTGNQLNSDMKANGRALEKHSAICLETQYRPNDIAGIILNPGEMYQKRTTFRFTNSTGHAR